MYRGLWQSLRGSTTPVPASRYAFSGTAIAAAQFLVAETHKHMYSGKVAPLLGFYNQFINQRPQHCQTHINRILGS